MSVGDRLVLYTDGIAEVKSKAGEFFGDQRLESLIGTHAEESPDALADHIVDSVLKWSGRSTGRPLDDDLTLVVADLRA